MADANHDKKKYKIVALAFWHGIGEQRAMDITEDNFGVRRVITVTFDDPIDRHADFFEQSPAVAK